MTADKEVRQAPLRPCWSSGIAFKAKGALRLWAPVIGVAAGSVVAGTYGLYDTALVVEAEWIGLPAGDWPGLDLNFGPVFWSLLPAFVFVTLVGAIETVGDAIAIQHVSWRSPPGRWTSGRYRARWLRTAWATCCPDSPEPCRTRPIRRALR